MKTKYVAVDKANDVILAIEDSKQLAIHFAALAIWDGEKMYNYSLDDLIENEGITCFEDLENEDILEEFEIVIIAY